MLLRLVNIPITHDESGQILYYAQQPIKEILSFNNPWPTNHILNSILIKISTGIFGINAISGRLPNLLCGFLYLFLVYKISKLLFKNNTLALVLSYSFFVLNPFLFEFFTLARGYGIAAAFLLACIYAMLAYYYKPAKKYVVLFALSGFLMVMANFSFLTSFAALQIMAFTYLMYKREWKYLLLIGAGIILTASFSALPIIRMNQTDQFVYWEGGSFVEKTIKSLWYTFKYDAPLSYLSERNWFLLLFFVFIAEFVLSIIQRKNKLLAPFASWLLLLTVLINLMQHYLIETPFLENRTALQYVVLYALVLLSLFYRVFVWNKTAFYALAFPVMLFLVVHFKHSYNTKFAYEWRYDQNTIDLIQYLDRYDDFVLQTDLNTHWLFQPSFNFYTKTQYLDWLHLVEYHKEAQYEKGTTYYYTIKEELPLALENNYEIVLDFEGERFLLKQKD